MSGFSRKLSRAEEHRAVRLSLRAARTQGCVCSPAFAVRWLTHEVPSIEVRHDDWCPLLRVRQEGTGRGAPQVVIAPNEPMFQAGEE